MKTQENKTPADAVLTTFLNLLKYVGAWFCCFGYSTYRTSGIAVDTHTANKLGSRFQGVGSKNECLITHNAGDYVFVNAT